MLIHAPYGGPFGRQEAWRALVDAQETGKVRSIGVSNYGLHHLLELEAYIKELESDRGTGRGGVISVGQWELQPWLARTEIVSVRYSAFGLYFLLFVLQGWKLSNFFSQWCKQRGIVVQAYSPLTRAKKLDDDLLKPILKRSGKTAAQVLIRWSLQMGFVPLPKSAKFERIEENADVYDFELTAEEMESLDTGKYVPCAWDPTISPLDL